MSLLEFVPQSWGGAPLFSRSIIRFSHKGIDANMLAEQLNRNRLQVVLMVVGVGVGEWGVGVWGGGC